MKKDGLFYTALVLGVVALSSAVLFYNHNTTKKNDDQIIDLNEGQALRVDTEEATEAVFGDDESKKLNRNDMKKPTEEEKTETENKDAVEQLKEVEKTSEESTEKKEETPSKKEQLKAQIKELTYNGEQSLKWPVEGNIVLPFSMDTTIYFKTMDQYQCNPGMLIEAKKGTAVIAAENGIVTKVENDPKLGNVITVALGNGFTMRYGQLDDVKFKVGDAITKGEMIGAVANQTKYFEKEGTHLYLEISKDGESFDPLTVLE